MKFLRTILRKANSFKVALRLASGKVASNLKLLGRIILRGAKGHKRLLLITGIALVFSLIVIAFYIRRSVKVRRYSIAYIGRHHKDKDQFDLLHELALRKYLDELNSE